VRAEELAVAEAAVTQAEAALQSAKSLRDKAFCARPLQERRRDESATGEQVMAGSMVLS
jgi:hypothetical protein